jgi:methylenetetrahydrofolate dehydrogenase (NADP+)/methenyltetrahydrofolate cyclohydrolase
LPAVALILDGKAVAAAVKVEVASGVRALRRSPGLATVLVGDDAASHVYVRGKRRDAEEVGMVSIHHELPDYVEGERLLALIAELNADSRVDGILVQLPLPKDLDAEAVVEAIDPGKDADGLHPANLGRLILDQPGLRPCTPSGVMRILGHYEVPIQGARAVVIGRSFLVGRPMALLLGARGVDATVTVAHSRSRDLRSITAEADLIVAAIGSPRFLTADMVKPGAVVVDVGINRVGDELVGDVDYGPVSEIASAITPVPGGVGPMTRAMLLVNTLNAARAHSYS